ncbi:hypothetical protein ACSVDA_16800 [Cytobacillus sp. Hm23]
MIQYIKTIVKYADNDEETREKPIIKRIQQENLTKDQFEKEVKAEKEKTAKKKVETTYKVLTTEIMQISSDQFRITVNMEWRIIPKKRLDDLMSFSFDNDQDDYFYKIGYLYGYQHVIGQSSVGDTKSLLKQYTMDYDSEHYILDTDGVLLSQDLKNDWMFHNDKYEVVELSQLRRNS